MAPWGMCPGAVVSARSAVDCRADRFLRHLRPHPARTAPWMRCYLFQLPSPSRSPRAQQLCGLNNGIRAGRGPALIATVGAQQPSPFFDGVCGGAGAMLLASEAAFTAVKWVGAAYLFWLGWKAWHSREFSGWHWRMPRRFAPGIGQPAQFFCVRSSPRSFCWHHQPQSDHPVCSDFSAVHRPCAACSASFWCSGPSIWAVHLYRPPCTPAWAPDPPLHPHLAGVVRLNKATAVFLWALAAFCWPPTADSAPLAG